ncbi:MULTISPECIES: DUF3293 domain-containing protein [Vibrio]|uniref:DUF3293 domain-containing protein n=1 Tax=Vibrio TaxID=662 RepID=UPI00057127E8|nr:DUF3293 domain-containing protein [Vibrio pacinii]
MAIDAHFWRAYQQPYFRFEALPVAKQFAIITAWNPGSEWQTQAENDSNNHHLAVDLVHTGYSRVLVGNQNFSWAEESFAAPITQEKAMELGRKFAQNAIYFIEEEQLFLLSCIDDMTRLPLGHWRDRCR